MDTQSVKSLDEIKDAEFTELENTKIAVIGPEKASGQINVLSHEERKRKTWPNEYKRRVNPFLMTLYLAPLLSGNDFPGYFGGSINSGPCRAEEPKKRKCALPECEVYFKTSNSNVCCCSKEHFLLLRERQKAKK